MLGFKNCIGTKLFVKLPTNRKCFRNIETKTTEIIDQYVEEPADAEYPIHTPVLLQETITNLVAKPNGVFLDCTFGEGTILAITPHNIGGHTAAILNKFPQAKIFALDRDVEVSENAKLFEEKYKGRFFFHRTRFGQLLYNSKDIFPPEILKSGFDGFFIFIFFVIFLGILMDVGVSSRQLSSAHRGFSFQKQNKGPLDMRMDGPDGGSIFPPF
jgi:16S rRNA (cytosine1402-N4)-methyltransferase